MLKKTLVFQGSGTAMVTPFTEDGGPNLPVLDQLIEFQLSGGTDALIVCGTTGEPSTMDLSEEAQVIARAVERVHGRVPVIAGAGSNDTAFAIRSAKQAADLGADALLLVTPYYNKTTQAGLIRHFGAVADAVDKPLILYNVPSRTGLNMAPETLKTLSDEHPNIVAVKEASGDIVQAARIARLCPELAIYSGNDDSVVPILSLGGKGVISVVANVLPRLMHDMVADYLAGRTEEARQAQLRMLPMAEALFCEVNPIPVKTALRQMGFACGPLRLPLVDMQEAHLQKLLACLRDFSLID